MADRLQDTSDKFTQGKVWSFEGEDDLGDKLGMGCKLYQEKYFHPVDKPRAEWGLQLRE